MAAAAVVQSPGTLLGLLESATEVGDFSISVRGSGARPQRVVSAVLRWQSPFFAALFELGSSEREAGCVELSFAHADDTHLRRVVRWMHGGAIDVCGPGDVQPLLEVARVLQLAGLERELRALAPRVISSSSELAAAALTDSALLTELAHSVAVRSDDALTLLRVGLTQGIEELTAKATAALVYKDAFPALQLAREHSDDSLEQKALALIARHFDARRTDLARDVDVATLCAILRSDLLSLTTEDEVLHFVLDLLRQRPELAEGGDGALGLASCVRLEHLTMDGLALARTLPGVDPHALLEVVFSRVMPGRAPPQSSGKGIDRARTPAVVAVCALAGVSACALFICPEQPEEPTRAAAELLRLLPGSGSPGMRPADAGAAPGRRFAPSAGRGWHGGGPSA
eukprot:TRINITY_DN43390_c0_g1_i1.p1 TRINITY_DN43390_c0_g1~~TRINITY_DN43390_c0_g1_i1.p1  ORF type:complete len:400 (+),score=96.31 TRINITY_DN43390_c0_g1_i1:85-1284(+)